MLRTAVALALALLVAVGIAGCAKKVAANIPPPVPATEANTSIGKDNNDNLIAELKVKHLALPQSLTPPRSLYVVWVETSDQRFVNAGRLKLNDNLEGSIRIMTPYPRFRLVISAEDDPLAPAPSSQRVVRTDFLEIR
jgi:hypothetical protein